MTGALTWTGGVEGHALKSGGLIGRISEIQVQLLSLEATVAVVAEKGKAGRSYYLAGIKPCPVQRLIGDVCRKLFLCCGDIPLASDSTKRWIAYNHAG